jgi:PAS domain S-box-containing protein/putative nucleotidyltransferase with HDIG domain
MSDVAAEGTGRVAAAGGSASGSVPLFLWRGARARLLRPLFWVPPVTLSIVVAATAWFSFLPAHVIAEMFCVMVAWVFFGLGWKTHAIAGNRLLVLLGCSFFWVGVLDLLHLMAYKGMDLLPIDGGNASSQLWLCARSVQVLGLLATPALARRGLSIPLVFGAFGVLSVALVVSIFSGDFPATFVEGKGLTTFKIAAEYAVVAALIAGVFVVMRVPADALRSDDKAMMIGYIAASILSEIAFTLYVDVYGIANLIGHILKIWAFWLIFEAIVQANFDRLHWTLRRLSEVVEQNPSMVVITDRTGVVEYVNPQFQTDTGYTADEAVGRHVNFLKSDEMPQQILDAMWKAISRGETWHGYFRNRRKDGSLYWDKSTITPIRDYRGHIQSYVAIKEDVTQKRQVEEFLLDSENAVTHMLIGAMEAMVGLLEARDPYTAGHSRNVGAIALIIAEEMQLPKVQVEGLRIAAMIHDIGKIRVPMDILNKPGKLTPSEFEIIKQHPQTAYDAIKGIPFPWDVPQIVLSHHEKWDGTGYPNGLKGEAIPLEAQILSVADVLDAVSAHRPYRPRLGADMAFQIIEEGRGVSFSPAVVAVALRAREKITKILK